MEKIYRILGKRGRITVPYEIRMRVGFLQNDVLSFEEAEDGRSVIVRRERICDCVRAQGKEQGHRVVEPHKPLTAQFTPSCVLADSDVLYNTTKSVSAQSAINNHRERCEAVLASEFARQTQGTEDAVLRNTATEATEVCRAKTPPKPYESDYPMPNDEVTLYDFLNGLSSEQQRAALIHLSVKWAERQGGEQNARA